MINDPPRAPLLTSVNVDYDSVELSWSIETSDESYDQSNQAINRVDIPEITGYFLYSKKPNSNEWEEHQVDAQQNSFVFKNLLCGSQYQFYVIAYNNVGKGNPSQAIAIRTKGSGTFRSIRFVTNFNHFFFFFDHLDPVPIAPKNWNSFITVNSTVALIRLDSWIVNGCDIQSFMIKYRPRIETEWLVVSDHILPNEQKLVELVDLKPATWYLLSMTAITDMGSTEETYMFSTLTVDGGSIRD